MNDDRALWGTVSPRTRRGVIARISSVLSRLESLLESSGPTSGRSPRSTSFCLLSLLVFWISPPITLVSPSFRLKTVSRLRVPMVTTDVGLSLPPTVSLARIELTSRLSLIDTSLFKRIVGSALTFTPTSTYWTLTWERVPFRVVVVIGTRVPTLNFDFSLFLTLIFGLERTSPLARVLPRLYWALGIVTKPPYPLSVKALTRLSIEALVVVVVVVLVEVVVADVNEFASSFPSGENAPSCTL